MSTRVLSWTAPAAALLCAALLAACSQARPQEEPSEAPEAGSPFAQFRPPAPPPLPEEDGGNLFADGRADPRNDFLFSGARGPRRVRSGPDVEAAPALPLDEPLAREPAPPGPRFDDAPGLEPRPERPAPRSTAAAERPRRGAARPRGEAIYVVWEALAREKQLLEDSRFRRRGGPQPPQKITLLSASHPDADAVTSGRSSKEHGHTAVLQDADMVAFLRGIERSGFYRHARPVGNRSPMMENENARGRVTIVRNGNARTLISMRGQGQNPRTRDIPRIYSETKQAIMVLKNMSPTLNVSHVGADPLRTR